MGTCLGIDVVVGWPCVFYSPFLFGAKILEIRNALDVYALSNLLDLITDFYEF
jgi:hypothetical protein